MTQDNTKLQSTKDMTDEEKLALAMAMADASFDDIQDLAKFVQLPKGTWFISEVVKAEIGLNQDNTQLQISVIFAIDTPIELAQFPGIPADAIPVEANVPPPGSLVSFQWQGPMGIQRFKGVFEPVIKSIDPLMSPRTFVETLASGSITGISIMTTRRADKEKVVPSDTNPDVMVPVTYNELLTVMAV